MNGFWDVSRVHLVHAAHMQQHFDRQTERANDSNITEDNVWNAAIDS